MNATQKPLAGLKVVELGTLIAGPFCTRIMAEFGAEVIKVEAPDGGDPLRKWRKLYEGTSLWWYVQARNKKSVTANLKHPEGREFVCRLIAEADILVENFRPGVLDKLGLGWDLLKADNPGLVMVRLSGFGQSGPYKEQPGFGAVGESMGGLRYVTGFPDRPPVRTGISIGDSIAALWGAIGALMALRHKEVNGGAGQVVDVALYEAVFAMMESLVSIARLNLMESWPFKGKFDVIFCRNVMIYFDAETRRKLVMRFYELLHPGGILAIGSAETLAGLNTPFAAAQASVYLKA